MIEVKISYFKESGKFYTNSSIGYPDDKGFYDIVENIRMFARRGTLPGLVEGCKEFDILVQIGELPHLIKKDNFTLLKRNTNG